MGNVFKTGLLLGILSVLLVVAGGLLGGRDGIWVAFLFSLAINGGMYFFSDRLALAASGAAPAAKKQAPQLYEAVGKLANKMRLPMPKLYIIPTQQANAFATGRSPSHASVAVTAGLLENLSGQELAGVLSHELAHVKNRDILVVTIAAVLASSISFIGNMAMYGGRSDDEDNRAAGPLLLVAAIFVPIAAALIQLAISRQREFGADEAGARTIGSGKPLARALVTIHQSARTSPMRTNPAFSSLYIGDPLGGWGGKLLHLFSTHPSVEERIKRLERI